MSGMLMYTIYHRPSDFPNVEYLVREVVVSALVAQPARVVGTADSLDAARELIPWTHDFNLGRQPHDDPVIVETWI